MARRGDGRGEDGLSEIPVDRQGRLVIPRHLRLAFGPVPTTVLARRVAGGVLLEAPPSGEVGMAEDGLPVLNVTEPVTNEEVLAAIDAERNER